MTDPELRAVSLVEVAEPSVWAELAAVVTLDGHLGAVVSPTCREALRSFHDTVVPALAAAGVPVLLRDARRTQETVEVARQRGEDAIARLSRAAATVLRQAQHHGLDAGLPAWDPESDAGAVRELLGAELVLRDDDERYHLAADLPAPPPLEIDVAEAIMPPTPDLPVPRSGPIALLHDLASLAAAIDHTTPSRTHAGTVARADVRRMAVRLATDELRHGGSLEGDARWGRALRALEALGAVSLDPIDRTLHLDLGLDDTLFGDTPDAVDRFVLRLVDADLRPAVAVVRATLRDAGDQAIDELVWMELLRDQQRALLFVPWHREGRDVYPGTDVPFDDDAFERIEAGQLRRLLERLEVLGLVRRAPGVFAATPDGLRWAGATALPPPPVWVSSDLQVIVPPDGVTPWERFQLERLGRCVRRDVVDVYVLERAGLSAWLRWHDLSEALALLARRAPAVPAAVVEALTTWARQATRIVVTRGVLV